VRLEHLLSGVIYKGAVILNVVSIDYLLFLSLQYFFKKHYKAVGELTPEDELSDSEKTDYPGED
jgi:hypothetical protein